jgi:hypothetical protein
MKMPEDPWVVLAAECWISLSRARRADPANPEAGSAEEMAYAEALDGAFAMEGLPLHQQGPLKKYGTREEQDRILMRVMMTAVELALDMGEEKNSG